jgi:hypothetical protein
VPHAKQALQHYRKFVELWSLAGLFPSLRAAHVRDTDSGRLTVDSANVFVDEFRFISSSSDPSWFVYQDGHEFLDEVSI